MRVYILRFFLASLFLLSLGSCGAKVGGSVGGECYECQSADYPCTCPQGYGGYYNPEALDIFRAGRFDDINGPIW